MNNFLLEAEDVNTVYPHSREEAQSIIIGANNKNLSIYPVGSGSKINQVLAAQIPAGILLGTRYLNKVVEYRPDNMSIEVEAGMGIEELNKFLAKDNLFFPVNNGIPGETVGGLVASNSGGRKKYMYKSTRHYVLGLEFISPTGELIKVGGRTIKNVSGYDISQLLAGSWGYLGLITKVTLRLKPVPQQILVMETRTSDSIRMKELIWQIISKGYRISALYVKSLNTEIILQVELEGLNEIIEIQSQELADGYGFSKIASPMGMQEKMMFKVALDLDNYLNGLDIIQKWSSINQFSFEFQGIVTNGILEFNMENKPDDNLSKELGSSIKNIGGTLYFQNNSLTKIAQQSYQKLLQNIKEKIDPNFIFMTSSRLLKE